MHLLATNACVWIRTLIRETLDSFLHHHSDSYLHNDEYESHNDRRAENYGGNASQAYENTTGIL